MKAKQFGLGIACLLLGMVGCEKVRVSNSYLLNNHIQQCNPLLQRV